MEFKEFFDLMSNCGMISSTALNPLKLVSSELQKTENAAGFMKLFTLYFSMIEEGNVFMPLEKKEIIRIAKKKITRQKNRFKEEEKDCVNDDEFDLILSEIKNAAEYSGNIKELCVTGKYRLFIVENNRLYLRKYNHAVKSIENSIDRIFKSNKTAQSKVDLPDGINLTDGQKKIISAGMTENLLVTGGPGTGKTFSIFFLLFNILKQNGALNVYLTAPSGKAADRMKESIASAALSFTQDDETVGKILNLEGQTIHRLLGYDDEKRSFLYNENHRFASNSVFVIDEASMIDVCVFASLLDAIPDGARVFILGDKNQLPAVECGAVFGEMLSMKKLKKNKVELDESKRFDENSEIFKLASKINRGKDLSIPEEEFVSVNGFKTGEERNKIYYYSDSGWNKTSAVTVADKWYSEFYCNLQKMCRDLTEDSDFDAIIRTAESARILCALNDTSRGAANFNNIILKEKYAKQKSVNGFFCGELLMVTRNNKSLDLFNGDCGVTVRFKDDETLYLMFKSHKKFELESGKTPDKENRMFKIAVKDEKDKENEFFFYPVGMINKDDLTPAFAITIHKSQGSDYENILVVLPSNKNHPLLNRQILYTAVTRTKGNTYIISNPENLNRAAENPLTRNTGLM